MEAFVCFLCLPQVGASVKSFQPKEAKLTEETIKFNKKVISIGFCKILQKKLKAYNKVSPSQCPKKVATKNLHIGRSSDCSTQPN